MEEQGFPYAWLLIFLVIITVVDLKSLCSIALEDSSFVSFSIPPPFLSSNDFPNLSNRTRSTYKISRKRTKYQEIVMENNQ
jgi:hypothetical protein